MELFLHPVKVQLIFFVTDLCYFSSTALDISGCIVILYYLPLLLTKLDVNCSSFSRSESMAKSSVHVGQPHYAVPIQRPNLCFFSSTKH